MGDLLHDKDEILDVLARYAHCADRADGDGYASLFTEDGVFDVGNGRVITGRDALRALASGLAGRGSMHCTMNEVIEVDGDVATCRSYLVLLKATAEGTGFGVAGVYDDELRRVDGRWQFARRTLEPMVPA